MTSHFGQFEMIRAWTFDEWYGRDGEFLDGLESLGQNYVAEVPANFTGWLYEPDVLLYFIARPWR